MIDRAEKEQEEKIFVENPQIQALSKATAVDNAERITEAFIGHYFRGREFLNQLVDTDLTRFDHTQILAILSQNQVKIDTHLVMEFLNIGGSVNSEDTIGYDLLNEIYTLTEEMMESTRGDKI